ncbi:MAG: hypothetical protein ILNGONEN_00782 [Syntrophorhabdaceae bacterium]|nr:hypothetical protein [Syntrophorhabdaceae bacterium]
MDQKIILYVNGRAIVFQLSYDEVEGIIDRWQSSKLSESSENRFLQIQNDGKFLHVDLKAVDAIRVKYL